MYNLIGWSLLYTWSACGRFAGF